MDSFREVQRLRAWWIWVLVILIPLFLGGILVYQMVTGTPVGDRPASNWVLLMNFLLTLLAAVSVLALRLEIQVDAGGIHYRMFPFVNQHVKWDRVRSAKLERLHAIEDFGGYGMRLGRRGWGYIVSGDHALYLKLANGNRVWLSTTQPEALGAAVRGYLAARDAADYAALKSVDESLFPGA